MPSRVLTRIYIWPLLLLLLWAAGCKKQKVKPAPAGATAPKQIAKRAPARPVAVPAEVLTYIGLRAPGKSLDDGLELIRKFLPFARTRKMLLNDLADNARIPRELLGTVDLKRSSWMIKLDDRQVGAQETSVVLFPVISRKSFETALSMRMQQAGTEGKLAVYKPRPGQMGLVPVKVYIISDEHVIVASDRKSLQITEPFIRGNLLGHKPAHDLELHLMVAHLMKSRGKELDSNINVALGQLQQDMQGRTGALGKVPAQATDAALRRYVKLFKATKKLLVAADVSAEQLTVTLRARATDGGLLHKVIKRQRPGAPLAVGMLPASSWLVLSDRGNPGAQKEGDGLLKTLLEEFFKEMDPALARELAGDLNTLTGTFSGDYSLALHRAPSDQGMTLSSITALSDAEAAREAADRMVARVGKWIKSEMKKRKEKMPAGFSLAQKPFKHKAARGTIFALRYPVTPGKEKEARTIKKLLGNPFSVGWAFVDRRLVLVLGQQTSKQLQLLVEGKSAGKNLTEKADFIAATAAPGRLGLFYLSLVDFIRWFEGSGNAEMDRVIAELKKKPARTAPAFTWGVNKQRSELDFTLRLPAEHFLTFKPAADKVMQGGLPAEMLPKGILPGTGTR